MHPGLSFILLHFQRQSQTLSLRSNPAFTPILHLLRAILAPAVLVAWPYYKIMFIVASDTSVSRLAAEIHLFSLSLVFLNMLQSGKYSVWDTRKNIFVAILVNQDITPKWKISAFIHSNSFVHRGISSCSVFYLQNAVHQSYKYFS